VAERIVLGSGSPRRREILTWLGLDFEVHPADIDESVLEGEHAVEYVRRLATAKSAVVAAAHPGRLVIAADTTVAIDGEILGKPEDVDDARRMVRRLAGRTHQVHTGVAVAADQQLAVDVETTAVTFGSIADDVVEWYVGLAEPYDKAGGYGLQGAGAAFVERIDGNSANVIGLPVPLLLRLAASIGHPLLP
jgi:septum formation protein